MSIDAAVSAVLADYEARAEREEALWDTLGPEGPRDAHGSGPPGRGRLVRRRLPYICS